MARSEGMEIEQVLTVGMLRSLMERWDERDPVVVDVVGRFGGESFHPVVGAGMMRDAATARDRALLIYAMEERDDG